ncbi:MAG: glycosyltransferase family 39 protein [Lentisphaeria bacterium]|nr:glycosyltransferase family 39 protein [Lentisphaeria bacterium]
MLKNFWQKTFARCGRDGNFFRIIAGTGLLLRLIYFYEFSTLAHFSFAIGPDVQEYAHRAQELLKGLWFPGSPEIHAPLYSFFLALFLKIFAGSIPLVRLLQLLLNWFAYTAMAKLLKEISGSAQKALWFLGFAMFTPVLFFHQTELISETLFAPLLAGFFFAVYRGDDKPHRFFAAGCWLGGLLLTHGLMIFFASAEIFWMLYHKLWRKTILLVAGIMVLILPVIVAKTVYYEKFTGIQGNGAFNLWLGHNPDATGGCYLRPPAWSMKLESFRKEAAGQGIGEESLLLGKIGRFYLEQPEKLLLLPLQKLCLLTSFKEEISGADPEYLIRKTAVQKFGAGMMGVVLTLGIAGVCFAVKKRETAFIHFYLLAGSIASGLLLTVVSGRYRQGLMPGLLLLAALGAYHIGKKVWLLIVPLGAASGFMVCFIAGNIGEAASITGEAYYRMKDWVRAKEHLETAALSSFYPARFDNMLGAIAEEQQDLAAAEKYYSHAVNSAPDDPEAFLNLAHLYFYNFPQKRQIALHLIHEALKRKAALPSAYDMLGQHQAQQGDFAGALKNFETACLYEPENKLYQEKVKLCRVLAAEKGEKNNESGDR